MTRRKANPPDKVEGLKQRIARLSNLVKMTNKALETYESNLDQARQDLFEAQQEQQGEHA